MQPAAYTPPETAGEVGGGGEGEGSGEQWQVDEGMGEAMMEAMAREIAC